MFGRHTVAIRLRNSRNLNDLYGKNGYIRMSKNTNKSKPTYLLVFIFLLPVKQGFSTTIYGHLRGFSRVVFDTSGTPAIDGYNIQ